MDDVLTLGQMARRTGEPEERLLHWRSLGLIGSEESERFRPEDVEKVRLVQLFLRRGIEVETIVQASKGGLLDREALRPFLPSGKIRAYSLAEVAELIGLDIDLMRRLWEAAEVGERREMCDEEDVRMLRYCKVALEAGMMATDLLPELPQAIRRLKED